MRKCRTGPSQGPKRTSSIASYDSRTRVLVLRTFFLVGGGLIFFRLFFLQVATHDKWVAMAKDLHGAEIEISADRGEVFIDDGG